MRSSTGCYAARPLDLGAVLRLTNPTRIATSPGGRPAERDWRPFAIAAATSAAAAAVVTLQLGYRIGGDSVTSEVSNIGQTLAALVAAASCGWAAQRSRGRLRMAWALLAASALSWGAGQVVWSYFALVKGVAVPFPSAADIGYLIAIPFAVSGVLAFPTAAGRGATRGRALLDGTMVALSLLFVSWALGLGQLYHQSQSSLLAQWIGLAYPIGDIVILTVLFIALRRSLPAHRGRLILLIGGLGANAFSDSTFAFLNANGSYLTSSELFSCGWIYGYAMVALAPLWPERVAHETADEGPITLWRMLLPWFGLIAVVATALGLVAAGRAMDPFLAFPGAGLVAILMASQALAYSDSLSLLARSKSAEAKLRERETMLSNVIDHAPQGVARITTEGRIANANPRLASMLASPLELVVGAGLDQFIAGEMLTRAYDSVRPMTPGAGDTYETEGRALRADGSEFWLHWSLTPIRRLDHSIDYFMAMFEDITAKHESEETAQANLTQLEKLNQLKSEFVSMVSHEFRTALVGIQGFSELLRDSDLDVREIKSVAGDINSDAERLSRMITRMLDLDRLEAGKIRLELRAVHVNDLIRKAVERARVSTANHDVFDDLQPNLPYVQGDPDRLTEVLSNLLSNAIKYSPDGGEIAVRSRLQGGFVEIAVIDHGLGIPPEFINRLFGRYERYENKNASKIIGTGLGLAITRQIVEMHGGKISVDSKVGSGSEFTFTIPVGG